MIDERGLTTANRTVLFAGLLVENLRRRFNVSDTDMDELAAGALGMLLHADAGNATALTLTKESASKLWRVVAGVDDARDRKTVN